MYNRLLNFLNECKIINKSQFGFRNNYATYMALLIMLEKIRNALDNGECAIGIFLHFQKAFDTVDHGILFDKLYNYGIRGIALDWFSSYLSKPISNCFIQLWTWTKENNMWCFSRFDVRSPVISTLYKWFTNGFKFIHAYIICWWHQFVLHWK